LFDLRQSTARTACQDGQAREEFSGIRIKLSNAV